jgi:hypothetical protein
LSSVDLPAPLRPMTPSTSPWPTSKLTSFSAQNVSAWSPLVKSSSYLRIRLKGVFIASMTVSRKLVCFGLTIPMR